MGNRVELLSATCVFDSKHSWCYISSMKTTISITDELFVLAEQTAKRLGISQNELYRRAISNFVECHNEEQVTEALNNVYSENTELNSLDSDLEQIQHTLLNQEQW